MPLPEASKTLPTIGRIVLLHVPKQRWEKPIPAIINHVDADGSIGVTPQYPYGFSECAPSEVAHLHLFDPGVGEKLLADGKGYAYYCEWMPYQAGQAAKTEQVEGALNKAVCDLGNRVKAIEAQLEAGKPSKNSTTKN